MRCMAPLRFGYSVPAEGERGRVSSVSRSMSPVALNRSERRLLRQLASAPRSVGPGKSHTLSGLMELGLVARTGHEFQLTLRGQLLAAQERPSLFERLGLS